MSKQSRVRALAAFLGLAVWVGNANAQTSRDTVALAKRPDRSRDERACARSPFERPLLVGDRYALRSLRFEDRMSKFADAIDAEIGLPKGFGDPEVDDSLRVFQHRPLDTEAALARFAAVRELFAARIDDRRVDAEEADGSTRVNGFALDDGPPGVGNCLPCFGELLEPEPSNLRVATATLDFPLRVEGTVELINDQYRRVYAAPFLSDVSIRRKPSGVDVEAVDDWDLVVGLEGWKRVNVELIGSVFRAGEAFGSVFGVFSYRFFGQLRVGF